MARRRFSRTPEIRHQQEEGRTESIPASQPLVSAQTGRLVAGTQHPTTGAQRMQSAYEKAHYGSGAPTTDIERLRGGRGIATGRVSPRIPQRPTREGTLMVQHGMADAGDVDPNQGRLFSHTVMAHQTLSDAEMSRRTGVPMTPASSGRGWLSRVGKTPTQPYGTVAEARAAGDLKAAASIGARKRQVLQRHGKEIGPTTRTPEEPDPSTPIKESMQRRQAYEIPGYQAHWYGGEAASDIEAGATREGTTTHKMRRAIAHGSPQMPWTSGHPEEDTFRKNNVEFARQMAAHVGGRQFNDPKEAAETFKVPAVRKGKPVEGEWSQVQTMVSRTHAARALMGQEPTHEEITSPNQKVPNFDVALAAADPEHRSRWARRQSVRAWTADTWDEKTMGIKSRYKWTGAMAPGGYDVAAMTGRRQALRSGRLPAHYQEELWVSRRGEEAPQTSQQLFQHTKEGEEKPTQAALPPKEHRGK